MNEVIKGLYEIEEKANQIMEEGRAQIQEMWKQEQQKQEEILRETEAELESRITVLKSTLEEAARQETDEIIQRNQEQIRHLEDTCRGNYRELAREIVKKITEV